MLSVCDKKTADVCTVVLALMKLGIYTTLRTMEQGRAQDFNNGYSKLGRTKIFFTAKDLRHTSDHNLKLFNIDMH